MLRLRKADGTVVEVPEGTFVELYNPVDGKVGSVWFQQTPGKIIRIAPGTLDSGRYEDMFKVKFYPTEIIQR